MPIISADARPTEPVKVFLGLGANIGNPQESIQSAFQALSAEVLSSARLSTLYLTEPQDVKTQPDFLNAACCGIFSGTALELLKKINHIEKNLGRDRKNENRRGPRSIDIDILLYGDYCIDEGSEKCSPWLKIPHERLNLRRFALVPMLELDPELRDPQSGVSFRSIEAGLKEQGIYTFDKLRYI